MKTTHKTSRAIRSGQKSDKADIADVAWQPWFLPKDISQRIIPLIPPGYRKRFRFCFDDFGCFRCGRKDIAYRSLGFCQNCHSQLTKWLKMSMKRHQEELDVSRASPRIRWYVEEINCAEALLADFLPQREKSRKSFDPRFRGPRNLRY